MSPTGRDRAILDRVALECPIEPSRDVDIRHPGRDHENRASEREDVFDCARPEQDVPDRRAGRQVCRDLQRHQDGNTRSELGPVEVVREPAYDHQLLELRNPIQDGRR